MGNRKDTIRHPGRIEKINHNKGSVTILSQSACSACHAKGVCNMSEMEEKVVDVFLDPEKKYEVGQEVDVVMQKALAPKAVFLGYILPFVVIMLSLVVLIPVTGSEGLAALISLGLLIPYYIVIYLFRDKLQKTFMFKVE
jgi:positive regulator of sigma E activity